MERVFGYLVSIVGIIVLVLGIAPFNEEIVFFIPSLAIIPYYIFFGVGLIVIIVGIMILRKSSGRQVKEVPIYHGKNVVGFRRVK